MSSNQTPKIVQILSVFMLSLICLFPAMSIAHNNVVVVTLGGDEPPEVRAGSEIYTNSIGMKFSLIPAGSFVMGSPTGTGDATHRPYWPEEGSNGFFEFQHIVTLSKAFYMQTTEVAQAQYQLVMGNNPSYFSATGGADCGSSCPVEQVSWGDAQNFIDALNVRENRGNCNTQPNICYSLPTES
jgi:formylglycine-generating enzyme required for sulfatase activity